MDPKGNGMSGRAVWAGTGPSAGSGNMGIWDILAQSEQRLRSRFDNAFSPETMQKLSEIRRQVLEQVDSRFVTESSGKAFPYGKISVLLYPLTDDQGEAFRAAFLEGGSLKRDILRMLEEAQVRLPESVEISVASEAVPGADPMPLAVYKIEFVKRDPSGKREMPAVRLTITKGVAAEPFWRLRKERVLVGRSPEVTDREGRVIRKNDFIFLDDEGEINSTVSYAHARIWWDHASQEFLIMDEVSRYGTSIVREERSLEVPSGNPCGIRLQSGDEVICGQARFRFELEA